MSLRLTNVVPPRRESKLKKTNGHLYLAEKEIEDYVMSSCSSENYVITSQNGKLAMSSISSSLSQQPTFTPVSQS